MNFWRTRYSALPGLCCLLVSCAAVKTEISPRLYSPLLSADDISQIKALVASRPEISLPVSEIRTEKGFRDRATVYTGRWSKVGDVSEWFEVEKHHGRWRIISRIRRDRVKAENILTVS